jgi:hypothetical protein
MIARYFKPLGLRYHILLVKEGAAVNALQSIQAKKLAFSGFGIVLGQNAMWYQS